MCMLEVKRASTSLTKICSVLNVFKSCDSLVNQVKLLDQEVGRKIKLWLNLRLKNISLV